jgi:predicted phage terminase large subunit-like protein
MKSVEASRWRWVTLKAIQDDGTALWPSQVPLSELQMMRQDNPWSFSSLYMQDPVVAGSALFTEDPETYDPAAVDRDGWRYVLSVDPAVSTKTSADHSVILVLAVRGRGDAMTGYVLDVQRAQITMPELARRIVATQAKYSGARAVIETVGGFGGLSQLLREQAMRIKVDEVRPKLGKYERAQGAAAAFNSGRLRVPIKARWLACFLDELRAFTGRSGGQDDQVDALSLAWSALAVARTPVQRLPLILPG